jgi:hypothetical protein
MINIATDIGEMYSRSDIPVLDNFIEMILYIYRVRYVSGEAFTILAAKSNFMLFYFKNTSFSLLGFVLGNRKRWKDAEINSPDPELSLYTIYDELKLRTERHAA